MFANPQPPWIDLPKGSQDSVKSAILHAIALAHYAIVYARAWAADNIVASLGGWLAKISGRLTNACAIPWTEWPYRRWQSLSFVIDLFSRHVAGLRSLPARKSLPIAFSGR